MRARHSARGLGGGHASLCPPSMLLPLEELVCRRALRLLLDLVGLEARNLFLQERDALVELLDREQSQILPDLVNELLLRALLVIECRHGIKEYPATGVVVTPAG